MKKNKNIFVCNQCGHQEVKWLGKCPQCESWNSFVEELEQSRNSKQYKNSEMSCNEEPKTFSQVKLEKIARIQTGISEVDRVFGGGIVPGSLTLFGGEPGVGKSTLLLELANHFSEINDFGKVLYVSGEESEGQVASRAERMGFKESKILFLNHTNWETILGVIKKSKPSLFILDSIQTTVSDEIQSPPGTISQIREVTYQIMNHAKSLGITSMVIGHVTKDGSIAGPKALEHMVDTVVYFEGDPLNQYRILRTIKNRFGNTNEIGMFEMTEHGLDQISNPSLYFINEEKKECLGRSITCTLEGTRPLFAEIQSLVVENRYGNGRRTTQGIDVNRLSMLLAVLEKYLNIPLQFSDVYLNVVTGLKLQGRDADLAILASLLSSIKSIALDSGYLFLGEVGLTGEIRPITRIEQRIREAESHNFKRVFLSNQDFKKITSKKIQLISVNSVGQLPNILGFKLPAGIDDSKPDKKFENVSL